MNRRGGGIFRKIAGGLKERLSVPYTFGHRVGFQGNQ